MFIFIVRKIQNIKKHTDIICHLSTSTNLNHFEWNLTISWWTLFGFSEMFGLK